MQKKVSAAVRAFGRAHKAGLVLLGGGVVAGASSRWSR